MVYDVTSAESFVNVKRWLHEINQNCDDVCRILGMYIITIVHWNEIRKLFDDSLIHNKNVTHPPVSLHFQRYDR